MAAPSPLDPFDRHVLACIPAAAMAQHRPLTEAMGLDLAAPAD